MDDELRYRTELADQFIARLEGWPRETWDELAAVQPDEDHFYRLALELATEATQLLGAERVAEYESVLNARAARIDDLMDRVGGQEEVPLPSSAGTLVRGAVHALLVRDTYGFNSGAFGELFRPFRGLVDIGDIERAANRVRTPPSTPTQPAARADVPPR
jgi:hypothetical protein